MERILGVNAGRNQSITQEISSPSRNDVNEADELSRSATEDGARKRGLSRTFFEAVDEGEVSWHRVVSCFSLQLTITFV